MISPYFVNYGKFWLKSQSNIDILYNFNEFFQLLLKFINLSVILYKMSVAKVI